jgi:triacylglycerol lipase
VDGAGVKRHLLLSLLSGNLIASSSMAASVESNRIVMVHGIFQRGYSFKPMKKKLESMGYDCLVPSLKPCDARSGIETLATQLQREIEAKWGKDADFHVIAHSMGGLVSRYYLQELGGYRHCHTLVTLATPHHGTKAAYCYLGKGAWQMRPNSAFLQQLDASSHRLKHMRLLSYRTPLDLIILPSTSSHWEMADNRRVWALAHPLVMHMPKVQREIIEVLGADATNASR